MPLPDYPASVVAYQGPPYLRKESVDKLEDVKSADELHCQVSP